MPVSTDKVILRDLSFATAKELAQHFSAFLKKQEKVLICQLHQYRQTVSEAAELLDASPVVMGPDLRWQAMLKQAFFSRATVLVGSPLFVLGLTKVARYTNTPLNIRTVVLMGDPCTNWMLEWIRNGLDASVYAFSCEEAEEEPELAALRHDLLSWTSVLDYRVSRNKQGLDLEVVTFPGERLPELPACARRLVRCWMPEQDVPFVFQ